MYDFYKNSKDEYVEGYLSSREEFNGIVFLLRESNDPKPDNFWFRRVVMGDSGDSYKDDARSKGAGTRYIKRFIEILESTPFNDDNPSVKFSQNDLCNAIYCNIHPEYGESTKTTTYKEVMEERSEAIIDMLSQRHKELVIFTCIDIYDNLKKYLSPVKEHDDGLRYSRKTLPWFKAEKNSCKIRIYKMYHPSRSGKILCEM